MHTFVAQVLEIGEVEADPATFHCGGPDPRLDMFSALDVVEEVIDDPTWVLAIRSLRETLLTEDERTLLGELAAALGAPEEEVAATDEALGHVRQLIDSLQTLAGREGSFVLDILRLATQDQQSFAHDLGASALQAEATTSDDVLELARRVDAHMCRIEYARMRDLCFDDDDLEPAAVRTVLWRGMPDQVRPTHWIVELEDGRYELLAPADDGWYLEHGTIQELVECLPESLFEHAVACLIT